MPQGGPDSRGQGAVQNGDGVEEQECKVAKDGRGEDGDQEEVLGGAPGLCGRLGAFPPGANPLQFKSSLNTPPAEDPVQIVVAACAIGAVAIKQSDTAQVVSKMRLVARPVLGQTLSLRARAFSFVSAFISTPSQNRGQSETCGYTYIV